MNENFRHWIYRIKTFGYFSILFIVLLIFILELKHYYNINLFPDVNGRLDDVYFDLKEKLFE